MTHDPTLGVTSDVDVDVDDDVAAGRLIRPYAITGGRTGAETDIGLEAQIQSSTRAPELVGSYRWEAARLISLVDAPMALIEISARLDVPIGVTRVLVSDLVDDGAVVVHVPQTTQSFSSLLERVLDGVRNL
jgi:hypothetical protein